MTEHRAVDAPVPTAPTVLSAGQLAALTDLELADAAAELLSWAEENGLTEIQVSYSARLLAEGTERVLSR